MGKKNICDYCSRIVIAVCILFMTYIIIGFITKNICYDVLGMTNPFVCFFIGDDLTEENADTTIVKVEIDWQALYPFKETENISMENETVSNVKKYLELTETIEAKIDYYVNNALPKKGVMLEISSILNKIVLGHGVQLSENQSNLLYMKNGYLTYIWPEVSLEDIEEIADSLADFNHYLAEKEIPFLYVNAGSKVCPSDRQLNNEAVEYTNENGDALQTALTERNVRYIDFRKEMLNAGLDWYNAYYKTDLHWTTQTGLWASKIIAETLNREYGYSFDVHLFELSAWQQISFKDFWIGGQGRKDNFFNSDVEEYTLLLPQFKTDLSIWIPTRALNLRGEYADTMVDLSLLNRIKSYSKEDMLSKPDAYSTSQLRNAALTTITNHLSTNNKGKKILFIQDSFGWYSTSFLATDISQIDVIYPMSFNGSIRTYIEESKPDMVVMMYCEHQIGEIDWTTHLDEYDLR